MKIESSSNSKFKEWKKLQEKKYRDLNNLFLVEDEHLLNEALKKGVLKEVIASNPKYQIKDIPFYEVSDTLLKKLSQQTSGTNVIGVCKKLKENEIDGNICILDDIQDPGNLGTIIRSAVAFNIKTLIVSPNTVDIYNAKTIRASEGMIFNLNIIKKDLLSIIETLKTKGYKIYGTNVKNGTNLKEINFHAKYAIIIGNEGNGVKENIQNLCDKLIYIPLNSDCESLNAAVATSIILYEASRCK